jgi:predicted DNA-binding transcriptional regulator YafY
MPRKFDTDATAAHKTLLLFTHLLFSGRRLWLPELARQFRCSKPTIMRMMATIEGSGVAEVESGIETTGPARGRRWYQLKNLPGRPHVGMTRDEVEKLAFCRDLLQRLLPEGIERVIAEGIDKVSALMARAEERGEATTSKAVRVSWGRIDYAPFQGRMETLLNAIPSHTVCEVEYRIPGHAAKTHSFVPVRLSAEEEILNIEGWNVTGKGKPEIRFPMTLAVHRIVSCLPTRLVLADCPPLPDSGGLFGLPGREGFAVRAVFSEEYSGFIRERIWSEGQEIIDLPDGGVELRFTAASEHYLLGWILGFGSGAELLEPEHLRRQIREEVENMLSLYDGGEEEA